MLISLRQKSECSFLLPFNKDYSKRKKKLQLFGFGLQGRKKYYRFLFIFVDSLGQQWKLTTVFR